MEAIFPDSLFVEITDMVTPLEQSHDEITNENMSEDWSNAMDGIEDHPGGGTFDSGDMVVANPDTENGPLTHVDPAAEPKKQDETSKENTNQKTLGNDVVVLADVHMNGSTASVERAPSLMKSVGSRRSGASRALSQIVAAETHAKEQAGLDDGEEKLAL